MAHAKVKNHQLPVLASIRVASPCKAAWSEMDGDQRSRFCLECKTQVFNLSEMNRDQAERLIIERNGDLCARYYQRADGTIQTADCTAGRRRNRIAAVAGIAALAVGGGAVAGYELADSEPVVEALPALADTDAVPIDIGAAETQHDVEVIKQVTDELEAQETKHIMGKISIIDRDESLEQLKVQKQKLDALRVEIERTK